MRLRSLVDHLLQPRAILFGIAVMHVVSMAVYVRQLELEMQALEALYPHHYHHHWNPSVKLVMPILLLVAAVGLIVNRWWSVLLAMLGAGRVIYVLGYLTLKSIHAAHDIPMLSWPAAEKAWYLVYQPRPYYLFEVVFAVVILIYSATLFGSFLYSKSRSVSERNKRL